MLVSADAETNTNSGSRLIKIWRTFEHLTLETTGRYVYQVESPIYILGDLPDRMMIGEFGHSYYRIRL